MGNKVKYNLKNVHAAKVIWWKKGINYAAVMSSVDMWRINPTTEKQKQIRKDQELQKE